MKNYNKSMAETSKKMKLNNGLEIPIMGLGTTRIRNLDDANNSMSAEERNKDVKDKVFNSIKHG